MTLDFSGLTKVGGTDAESAPAPASGLDFTGLKKVGSVDLSGLKAVGPARGIDQSAAQPIAAASPDNSGGFFHEAGAAFKRSILSQNPQSLADSLDMGSVLTRQDAPPTLIDRAVKLAGRITDPIGTFADDIGAVTGIHASDVLKSASGTVRGWAKAGDDGSKPSVPTLGDIHNMSDAVSYVGSAIGNAAGSSAPSLVAGTAVAAATKNPVAGFFAGAFGPSYIQNSGDTYATLRDNPGVQQAIKDGKITDKQVAGWAAAASVPIAALDAYGAEKMLPIQKLKGEIVSRVLKRILIGGVTEGGTEGFQQVLQEATLAAAGGDHTLADAAMNVIENTVQGTIGGTAVSVVTEPFSKEQPSAQAGAGVAGGAAAQPVTEGAGGPPPPSAPSRDSERLNSPRLTPADRASPLPNDLIDDGKKIFEEALGKQAIDVPTSDIATPSMRAEADRRAADIAGTAAPASQAAPSAIDHTIEGTLAPAEAARAPGAAPVASLDFTGLRQISGPASATVDEAAHAAATSPQNALPEPTQAMKEAGNYKVGHTTVGGLDVSIENPQGSTRSGVDPNGKPWTQEMQSHYGYIKGTVGKDKDHVDVFVKPGTPSEMADDAPVFVVDQKNDKGGFDEHKILMGFANQAEADAGYHANYQKGWRGAGAITPTTLGEFKGWLANGDTTKPFGNSAIVPDNSAGTINPAQLRNSEPAAQTALKQKIKAKREAALPPITKQRAPQRVDTPDIVQFLASKGGVQDFQGELKSLDLKRHFVPGSGKLVRETGMNLDRAREAAQEAGYITPAGNNQTTTVGDLLRAIDENMRGNRVYSREDAGRVQNKQADKAGAISTDEAAKQAEMDSVLKEYAGILTPDEISEIERMVGAGEMRPDEAAMEVLERNAVAFEQETHDSAGQGETFDVPFDDQGKNHAGAKPADKVSDRQGSDQGAEGRSTPPVERAGRGEPAGSQAQKAPLATEPGADNKPQTVIPGAARISQATQAQREADKPMRPKVSQKDAGALFDGQARSEKQREMFSFAGSRAETLNRAAFMRAQDMRDAGASRDDVYDATGFFVGPDGRWRFEISDADAKIKMGFFERLRGKKTATAANLSDVLDHPKLFKAYPALADLWTSLTIDPDAKRGGSFEHDVKRIEVTGRNKEEALSILLHEVAHAIQGIEGFARGGSGNMGETYDGPKVEAHQSRIQQLSKDWEAAADANDEPQLDAIAARIEAEKRQLVNAAQFEYYRRISGEVEARNVQTRDKMRRDAAGARKRGEQVSPFDEPDAPWWTQDVPADKVVIVRSESHGEGFKALSASASASSDTIQPTDAFKAQAQAIGKRLRAELDRLGLKDIGLRISENLGMMVDGRMHAADGQYFQKLITIALDAENPDATLSHEAIHALRELSLFGKDEWAILERQSRKKWMAEHKIAEAYGAFPEWVQVEEGIAHAYGEWSRQGAGFDGIIVKAFRKIKAVLRAIARAFGKDFTSFEDVFAKIDRGEVGSRPGNVEFLSGGPMAALRSDIKETQRSLLAEAREVAVKNGMPSTFVEDVYFVGSQAAGKGTEVSDHDFVVRISGDMSDRAANDAWGALIDHFNQKKTVDIGGKPYKADIFVTDELYDGKPAIGTQEKFALRRAAAAPAPAQRRTTPPVSILPNISTLTSSVSTRIMNAIKGGPGKNDGETIRGYSARKITDYLDPLKRMIDSAGPAVTDATNAYQEARLAMDAGIAAIQEMHRDFVTPSILALHRVGASLDDLHRYLYALHTEERNRVVGLRNDPKSDFYKAASDPSIVGASGWSTNQAVRELQKLRADLKKYVGIREAGRLYRQMLDENLLAQKDAGLISQATYDALTSQWKNYVPLHAEEGVDENGDFQMPGRGRGFDVRGKEFKGATGRFSEAENIPGWAIATAERSKLRQAKEPVGQALLRFIARFDPMGTKFADVFWAESSPPAPGGIQKAPTVYKRELDASGKVVSKAVPYSTISPEMYATKIGGKAYYIQFTDPKVGAALKNMNALQLNLALRVLRMGTNLVSLVNTRLNPEFVYRNFFRDALTALVHLTGFNTKETAKVYSSIPSAWAAVWNAQRGHPGTGPMDQALAELTKTGGRIIFEQQKTVEDSIASLHAQMKSAAAGTLSPSRAWEGVKKLVGDVNDTVEMGMRLAAYAGMRAKGKTAKQASLAIRDLTVDFRKHGEFGPTGNAFYAFFNASVQGSVNVIKNLATSRRAQKFAGGLILAGFMMDMLNRSLSGDDDDGENIYDKMLREEPWKFERQMILFYGPGKNSYFTIPLAYGYNVFAYMGLQAGGAGHGNVSGIEAISDTLRVGLDAYNPIGGGGDILKMLTPTALVPFSEIKDNKNFADIPIYPNQQHGDTTPDSHMQQFAKTPWAYRLLAEQLNDWTGGNKIESGAIDVHPESIKHIADFVTGGLGRFFMGVEDPIQKAVTGHAGDIDVGQLPFVRTMYGAWSDQSRKSEYYKLREAVGATDDQNEKYKDGKEDPAIAADYETFKADHKVEIDTIPAFDFAEKRLGKLRKTQRRLEADKSKDHTAELKTNAEAQKKAMDTARKAYADNAKAAAQAR